MKARVFAQVSEEDREKIRKKAEEEVKEELRKEVEVTIEKINILFRKLNQEGRMSEWIRSTEDLEYQRELIREMENGK